MQNFPYHDRKIPQIHSAWVGITMLSPKCGNDCKRGRETCFFKETENQGWKLERLKAQTCSSEGPRRHGFAQKHWSGRTRES